MFHGRVTNWFWLNFKCETWNKRLFYTLFVARFTVQIPNIFFLPMILHSYFVSPVISLDFREKVFWFVSFYFDFTLKSLSRPLLSFFHLLLIFIGFQKENFTMFISQKMDKINYVISWLKTLFVTILNLLSNFMRMFDLFVLNLAFDLLSFRFHLSSFCPPHVRTVPGDFV